MSGKRARVALLIACALVHAVGKGERGLELREFTTSKGEEVSWTVDSRAMRILLYAFALDCGCFD